jgi:anti-anti-sigma regulatory factor
MNKAAEKLEEKQSTGRRRRAAQKAGSPAAAEAEPMVATEETAAPQNPTLQAASGGNWIEPAALRQWALEQFASKAAAEDDGCATPRHAASDLAVDVAGVDYLEAGVLQILIAVEAEQMRRGHGLRLLHASASLREWFEYAGATDLLDAGEQAAAAGVLSR